MNFIEIDVGLYTYAMNLPQTCLRCGHTWQPRGPLNTPEPCKPVSCPKCKSPYWDKPRKIKKQTISPLNH